MASKYFTVEVNPFIAASAQAAGSAAYSADDVLFDWASFQVPRGANKLIGVTAVIRGADGATNGVTDLDFYFAKSISGTAPVSIGLANRTADGKPIVSNHLIGLAHIDGAQDYGNNSLDLFSIASTGGGGAGNLIPGIVLEGEPSSGDNVGYDTLYVAGSTNAAISFGTTVLTRGAVTDDTTLIVETDKGSDDDPDADLIFAVGDVLHSATDDVLGTIGSIGAFDTNNQPITFTAPITDDLGDNEELFNVNPIRLILSFER